MIRNDRTRELRREIRGVFRRRIGAIRPLCRAVEITELASITAGSEIVRVLRRGFLLQ